MQIFAHKYMEYSTDNLLYIGHLFCYKMNEKKCHGSVEAPQVKLNMRQKDW